MKYRGRLLIAFLLFVQIAWAGSGLTSAFEFLRTDYNPRTAAMSDAFLTIRGDVNGLFVNPAGGAYIGQRQFYFNYTNYLLDINGGSAGYTHLLPRWGRLSVGVQYMDYGKFDETNEYAESTGRTFGAHDFALGVSLADTLGDHFSYGVTLKYVFSMIENYTAQALALDFGLLYEAPFEKDLFFAVVLSNVGQNFDPYADLTETLPVRLRLGVSKKLEHLPLEIGVTLNDLNVAGENLSERVKRFAVGGEFRLSKMLRLRLGYNNDLHSGLGSTTQDKFGGLSGGFGVNWKNYRFDYAFSNMSALGSVHRVGVYGILP